MPPQDEVEIRPGQQFPPTRPGPKTLLLVIVFIAAVTLIYDWHAIAGYVQHHSI